MNLLFSFLLFPFHGFLWNAKDLYRKAPETHGALDTEILNIGMPTNWVLLLFQTSLKGPCVDELGPRLCSTLRKTKPQGGSKLTWKSALEGGAGALLLFLFLIECHE